MPVLLLARADVDAREILRALRRLRLREMHHIHRRLALGGELLQRLRQRDFRVGKLQRHRARPCDFTVDRRAPGELRQFLLEELRLAQRRGHQQEARLRQREQRHLPRHAAVAVGVPVELVHHHVVHVGVRALAQGDVGEDLGGAAQDGRVAIHRGVAGGQAHVVRPELAAQVAPLLVHQRLDRAGIDRAPPLRERLRSAAPPPPAICPSRWAC